MTTKITVDAHAGWPVEVTAIDRFQMNPLNPSDAQVRISALGIIPGGAAGDYHVSDSREIVIRELRRTDAIGMAPPRPLDFGDVVRGLKAGKRFARQGWNGRDMFIFLVPGSRFKVSREPLLSILGEGTEVDYHGHVDMRTANGQIVPWLCSQTDMLAEDWREV